MHISAKAFFAVSQIVRPLWFQLLKILSCSFVDNSIQLNSSGYMSEGKINNKVLIEKFDFENQLVLIP